MFPLQAGAPVSPEMAIVLVLSGVLLIVPLVVSVFVYRDAQGRNSTHALAWGICSLLGGVVVWVLYFVVRDEIGPSGPSVSGEL